MPLTRRHLMESALAGSSLPGFTDYFLNWLVRFATAEDHVNHIAPPEPPLLAQYTPKFFDREDFAALESICSILIPTDEFPGAHEARCALWIDYVLAAAGEYAPEQQRQWRAAMAHLRELGFHAGDQSRREALVREMARPEFDAAAHHPGYSTYRLIKSENAFAFVTSRAGLIETLDYKGNTYNAVFPACTHPEHKAAPAHHG